MSVVRNASYNLASALVPIAIALITVPLTIAAVGADRYGVMALFGLFLGYFGVFDFGLSTATAQRVASAPPGDDEARRAIVWTALGTNLALGLAGAAAIVPAAWMFLAGMLKAPAALEPEIARSIVWLAPALPLMLLAGVLRGALQGSARFAEINLVNLAGAPLMQLLPLVAALVISPRLDLVIPALLASRVVHLLGYGWFVRSKVLGSMRPHFDRKRVRDLLGFGGWVALTGLVGPLMVMLDRFVIGATIGARAVSHYTVPFQLAERTTILPAALVDALFPRVAAEGDAQARGLSERGLRAVGTLMLAIMVPGILLVEPFLALWIDPGFAAAAAWPARILLIGFWFNTLGFCCAVRLQAGGRPKALALTHTLELVPYFALLYVGLQTWGLAGAAGAFALRVVADDLVLAWLGGMLSASLRITAIGVAAFGPALWIAAAGLPWLPSALLLAAVAALGVHWLAGERDTLTRALRRARPLEPQEA